MNESTKKALEILEILSGKKALDEEFKEYRGTALEEERDLSNRAHHKARLKKGDCNGKSD